MNDDHVRLIKKVLSSDFPKFHLSSPGRVLWSDAADPAQLPAWCDADADGVGIDYNSDAIQEAREQGAAIERARILASLKAIEPDEFARGLYDSLAARVDHRAKREHHARVLAVIEGDKREGV